MTLSSHIPLYVLIFFSAFLGLQAILGASKEIKTRVRYANRRAKQSDQGMSSEEIVQKLRKDRGLDQDGRLKFINHYIAKHVLQSGLPLGGYKFYLASIVVSAIVGTGVFLWKSSLQLGMAGALGGLFLPFLLVLFFVKRRREKAVSQLPEALDTIVRSLKAGHPVSVAMALVGREMPDPIGSEFATASDEVSYGSPVSVAIQRMADRVGHEDFDLFAAMIRLQERTGGNLTELLGANATTIRNRYKMRLKIKAASAEGRVSAMILNAAPVGLYLIIRVSAPDFYGDVSDVDIITYGMWGVVIWMVIGNLVMRKMINFRI